MRMHADMQSQRTRRGMTSVETALVMSVFLMFVFGVFEYARYLMTLQVATNAAYDGARYASTHTSFASNFDTTDSTRTDTFGNNLVSIQKYTTNRMGGTQSGLQNFKVEVFPCDNTQLYANPPVIAPKTGWGPDPAARSVNWNEATFTERIAVRITGTYQPILPSFLWMDSASQIRVVAVIGSEG